MSLNLSHKVGSVCVGVFCVSQPEHSLMQLHSVTADLMRCYVLNLYSFIFHCLGSTFHLAFKVKEEYYVDP